MYKRQDKYRAEYYEHYTGGNYWTNPVNYDLTINTERVGFEGAVKLVEDYIQIKYPDFNIKCTNTGSTQEA